jgi:hypothetical protein
VWKAVGEGVAARCTGDGYAARQWGRAASGDGTTLLWMMTLTGAKRRGCQTWVVRTEERRKKAPVLTGSMGSGSRAQLRREAWRQREW